jgi:hypothetical protein
LWRMIRYNLLKQFPNMGITINKVSHQTYVLSIADKNIFINFTCNFHNKNIEMYNLVLNTLSTEIKDRLFIKNKKKKK